MRLLRSETVRTLILALEVKKGKMLIVGLFSVAKRARKRLARRLDVAQNLASRIRKHGRLVSTC